MKNNYVVIMAGGVGSRFWPYSRNNYPKQFIDVLNIGSSLLRMTYERFLDISPSENIYIVTNEDYAGLVKEQIPELSNDQILLEPHRRNTAPCIAYASYKIRKKNENANIVVAPSDHAIFKEDKFKTSICRALEAASESDKLITLGIKPTRPETGYGYIQYIDDGQIIKKVKTFTEKPAYDLAAKFVESGEFVWNAGIFIWNVNSIVKAFEAHLPDIAEVFEDGAPSYFTEQEDGFIKSAYSQCKNISIDYGIMEKSRNVYVELGDFQWSDLGSWSSLHEIRDKDADNNVIDGNALVYDVKNSVVVGPKDKLIVAEGLDNYLVAHCGNVVLICHKDNEKKFRTFVADVKSKKGEWFI
ncbi:sugar phosphate nucleotidyltransferase [Fulvivirgaceae bacterium BMA10]|uniref:Sugar phosphate nucleotidyltransferase n=1 Tax=Splendidivirga corallicola TaxID=3051826 RepID=A0ABT8KXY7_9BACT|nr:sugar phosphate nucleotidyltransferase [Fulvivirgaceae bacterium BMA10]